VFLAHAQVKDRAVAVQETEAVVTVTKVDRETRTVTFRGPQGNVGTLTVPPESQNLDQVKPGQQYRMRGPKGSILALKVADDVKLEELSAGDRISVTPTEALAVEMVAQPAKKAPANKAPEKKAG
jgi:Cu/Ag efflux protein CusF